mmetsp:Transcript_22063/g.65351  ORF Transcript_22063/g.65351 Transcript_22063/m.65351 type:complete len:297 (-) Transcript_22063:235-1125(-)
MLLDRDGMIGPPLDGGVVPDDDARRARDYANARDYGAAGDVHALLRVDASFGFAAIARIAAIAVVAIVVIVVVPVVHPGQRAQFQKGSAGIDQRVDAFAGEHLIPLAMTTHRAFSPARSNSSEAGIQSRYLGGGGAGRGVPGSFVARIEFVPGGGGGGEGWRAMDGMIDLGGRHRIRTIEERRRRRGVRIVAVGIRGEGTGQGSAAAGGGGGGGAIEEGGSTAATKGRRQSHDSCGGGGDDDGGGRHFPLFLAGGPGIVFWFGRFNLAPPLRRLYSRYSGRPSSGQSDGSSSGLLL